MNSIWNSATELCNRIPYPMHGPIMAGYCSSVLCLPGQGGDGAAVLPKHVLNLASCQMFRRICCSGVRPGVLQDREEADGLGLAAAGGTAIIFDHMMAFRDVDDFPSCYFESCGETPAYAKPELQVQAPVKRCLKGFASA